MRYRKLNHAPGLIVVLALAVTIAAACAPQSAGQPVAAAQSATDVPTATLAPVVVATGVPPSPTPQPTATFTPTPTATPAPTDTPTPTATATPNRDIQCSTRMPNDDLFTIVTLTYGLSRIYEPQDLVPIAPYMPAGVTLGYPTMLRAVVIQPLAEMITDMQTAGLHPTIISGYRSYSAQAIAREKWVEKEPERVNMLSAPPGFSEHQLGTAVDFGSPELPGIVGQEDVEFHTWFYKTSEGIWLLENAHKYGFTLSYPFEASELTGFYYEPWHYRYVGVDMATQLKEAGISLTEHQLANEPPPCIPDPK